MLEYCFPDILIFMVIAFTRFETHITIHQISLICLHFVTDGLTHWTIIRLQNLEAARAPILESSF
jgi:hypothetical protein